MGVGMHYYVGVTDTNWFNFLKKSNPEDVNFWKPNDTQFFKAIEKGSPFLFKLKAPYNAIGGVGFFSAFALLPLTIAWDAFEQRNGCESFNSLRSMILKYRTKKTSPIIIGCIILTNPIFFNESEFIAIPPDWSKNIVSGKGYDDTDPIGSRLWDEVKLRLQKRAFYKQPISEDLDAAIFEPSYKDTVSKVRIGQGAFRVMVSEAYGRSCAITGDHTLPVLEAAHIRAFSSKGPNNVSNGLLLRSDLHKLYDRGYITITKDHHVVVSKSLKEEFNNGKIYYQMHGKRLCSIPKDPILLPRIEYLEWHNENVFLG